MKIDQAFGENKARSWKKHGAACKLIACCRLLYSDVCFKHFAPPGKLKLTSFFGCKCRTRGTLSTITFGLTLTTDPGTQIVTATVLF